MKLARIAKPLRSVQVRVTLAGELNAALESYARYYEHVHGDSVEPRALIPEILAAFIEADREFQAWSRSSGKQSPSPPRSVFDQPMPRHKDDSAAMPSPQTRWRSASRVPGIDTSLIRE